MIKDVKTYFQTVANRLSNAFTITEFDKEEELEFWALAAEHMSREQVPQFSDIVEWADYLYRAPVHFVYRLDRKDKLKLFRRQVLVENIFGRTGDEELTSKQKRQLREFEEQLSNLQPQITRREEYLTGGISSYGIGKCEHIPLYQEGDFWGIYCAGPFTKSPDKIKSKLSIVGRILADWLIAIERNERPPQDRYEDKAREVVGNLGTGRLNITGISTLFLEYLVSIKGGDVGAIMEAQDSGFEFLAKHNIPDTLDRMLTEKTRNNSMDSMRESLNDPELLAQVSLDSFELLPLEGREDPTFLLLGYANEPETVSREVTNAITGFLKSLLDFRSQNEAISDELTRTYYTMLRELEKQREKTRYHTPRLIGLVEKFGELFGLDEVEQHQLSLTARLHDIGYIGTLQLGSPGMGAELEHPLVGGMMVDLLPLHHDVKEGIKTHHEWVNGSGSPKGLEAGEIPWTGKIISVFEFITEFIETHQHDDSRTGEEWIERLSDQLIERADNQFDMVLIPTVIDTLNELGWDQCCNIGTEDRT